VSERLLLVLIEGRPGVGKTTVARRLGQFLRKAGVPLAGFVTEELREGGNRVGFALETFDGRHGVLAHVGLSGPPRVGKYGVDVGRLREARPAGAGVAARGGGGADG
jgi:nucleoside-triphosphatase